MIIGFSHIQGIAQVFIIAFISLIITALFHKIVITDENVIYQMFNFFVAFLITLIIDIITCVKLKLYLSPETIIQEIALIIATPFISQKYYDWVKAFIKNIKTLKSRFKVTFYFKIEKVDDNVTTTN